MRPAAPGRFVLVIAGIALVLAVAACAGGQPGPIPTYAPLPASTARPQPTAPPAPTVRPASRPAISSIPPTVTAPTATPFSAHTPTPGPVPLRPPKPIPTLIPVLAATPKATPPQSPTPAADPEGMSRQDLAATLEFNGFIHTPVDFDAVLNATSTCTDHPRLEPFFNYYNTSHVEGPKIWYVWACPGDIVKVYLPANGILYEEGIRAFGSEEGIEGQFNGEEVLINVQAQFDVSSDITVFYQHLTLRDEIIATVKILQMASSYSMPVLTSATSIGHPPILFIQWTLWCATRA